MARHFGPQRQYRLMGKKLRILVAAAFLALFGMLLRAWMQPKEPVYDGHPVSYWVYNLPWPPFHQMNTPPPHLPTMDSNAIPFLVRDLRRNSGTYPIRRWTWRKLPNNWRKRFSEPVPPDVYRMLALDFLGGIGPDARKAIPAILNLLETRGDTELYPELQTIAIRTLARIDRYDPAVIEALSKAAQNTNTMIRTEAVLQLQGPGDVTPYF